MTFVKICGITNLTDLQAAVEAGADYVGVVREPSSPRYVENPSELVEGSAGKAVIIGVYGSYNPDPYVQLFDGIQSITDVPVPNLLRVTRLGEPGVDKPVDGVAGPILLDAYHENAFGGVGKTINWAAAAKIVRDYPHPVFLAGGLTPENVAEAIGVVRPFAVDVSSGVEMAPGKKDHDKIRAFIQAVRNV